MHICVFCSEASEVSFQTNYVIEKVSQTLHEFGNVKVEINKIKNEIDYSQIENRKAFDNMLVSLKKSDGVIFSFATSEISIDISMLSFLGELCKNSLSILQNKNCFTICVCVSANKERCFESSLVVSRFLNSLNLNESVKMFIDKSYLSFIGRQNKLDEIIEKQAEDFYRIVRQNRLFFTICLEKSVGLESEYVEIDKNLKDIQDINSPNNFDVLERSDNLLGEKNTVSKIYESQASKNYDSKDIAEITKMFSNKLNKAEKKSIDESLSYIYNEIPLQEDFSKNVATKHEQSISLQEKLKVLELSRKEIGLKKESEYANDFLNVKPFITRKKSIYNETSEIASQREYEVTSSFLFIKTENFIRSLSAKNADLSASIGIVVDGADGFCAVAVFKPFQTYLVEIRDIQTDLLLTSSEKSWLEVMDRRISLQKAFMAGKIKVKGNFLLINSLDRLFS